METPNEEVPLSVAAFRAGESWSVFYRRVLRGEVRARRAGTRWMVDAVDLERFLASRGGRAEEQPPRPAA